MRGLIVKRFGPSKGVVMSESAVWLKVLDPDELPDGRVKAVTCQHRTLCLTHFEGQFAALDNKCPHQGGPLGEGSIEEGLLRCPWHGWDFDPLTGKPPGGFDDGVETFPLEVREDGVYVAFPGEDVHVRTVSDVMVETLVNWGVQWVWGIVGHSNLGFADAMRRQEAKGALGYFGIRHEGAAAFAASAYGKLTGRPAASFRDRGARRDQSSDGVVGRACRSRADARVDRPGPDDTHRARCLSRGGSLGGVWGRGQVHGRRSQGLQLRRACRPCLQTRDSRTRCFPHGVPRRRAGRRSTGHEGRVARGPNHGASDLASGRIARASPDPNLRGQASGDHRRARGSVRDGSRHCTRRAAQRAGDDDVQREGAHRRRSSPRLRSARAQRYARCELVHERSRLADRLRGELQQPHRHHELQADRSSRLRPHDARAASFGDRSGLGRDRCDRRGS